MLYKPDRTENNKNCQLWTRYQEPRAHKVMSGLSAAPGETVSTVSDGSGGRHKASSHISPGVSEDSYNARTVYGKMNDTLWEYPDGALTEIIDRNGFGRTALLQFFSQTFVNHFLKMEVESYKEWSAQGSGT